MRARNDHHTAVVPPGIAEGDAHSAQVVVTVRIVGKILVPLHRATAVTGFHVELVALGAYRGTDQRRQGIKHAIVAHQAVKKRMVRGRGNETPDLGVRHAVVGLEIEMTTLFGDLPRPLDEIVDDGVRLCQLVRSQYICDDEIAVGAVEVYLILV